MATLTVGNRTHSVFTRAIMPVAIVTIIVGLVVILFGQATRYDAPSVRAAQPTTVIGATGGVETTVGKSHLWFAGTLPVIEGDGDAIDSATLEAAAAAANGLLPTRMQLLAAMTEDSHLATNHLDFISEAWATQWALRNVDEVLTPNERSYLAALTAVTNASGTQRQPISYASLIRGQFALDIGEVPASSLQAPTRWPARSLTAIKKTSSSALVATQLAFPGLIDGGASWQPIARLVRPATGYAYVEIATPGMVGGFAGANREGLFVVLQIARTSHRARVAGRPSPTVLREILLNAGSLDDAWSVFEKNATQAAYAMLVYDARNQAVGWFEHAKGRPEWIKRAQGPVFGDGLIGSMRDDSDNDRGFRVFPIAERQKRMAALLADPIEDARALALRLSDRLSVDKQTLPTGHRAAVYDPEAWATVIFDPGSMMIWIAEDATRARWQGLAIPDANSVASASVGATASPRAMRSFELPAMTDAPNTRQALAAARQARALRPNHPALARVFADKAFTLAPQVPVILETAIAALPARDQRVGEALMLRWELARPDNRETLEQARATMAHP